MATINLSIRSKKNPANIYLRFSNTKAVDIWSPIGVYINPLHWDKKNQKIRNVIEIENRDEINSKLAKLKIHIIDEHNIAFMDGKIIDKQWIDNSISKFLLRPKNEVKKVNLSHNIYLTDFMTWWLDNKASEWKISASKYLSHRTECFYRLITIAVIRFERLEKIKIRDIDNKILSDFSKFLTNEKYSESTVKKMIGRVKFFCTRAKDFGIEVNENYTQTVFIAESEEEYKYPYLNVKEVNKVFKLDLRHDDLLDNVRDNFIIGLWTGLRVSDFLTRLKLEDLSDGYINIRTLKTKTWVSLPVHEQIEMILNKRGGFFPSKISEPNFNKHIKTICQLVDMDEDMLGGVTFVDPKTKVKRKKVKVYKKYELITSHSCRRSFVSNHIGKLPNSELCKLGGWSTEEMMLHYDNSTSKEAANELKKYWETQKKIS